MRCVIYDVINIGGGPGGYFAAERAAKEGLKVAVIEKDKLGGTCLNCGCIPTKSWLYLGKTVFHVQKEKDSIMGCDAIAVNQKASLERKNRITAMLMSGISNTLKACGVDICAAEAIRVCRSDELFDVTVRLRENGAEQHLKSRNIILACGSEVLLPQISGLKAALEAETAVTSKEFLNLRKMPDKLVVVGGGIVGLELADYAADLGSKVTVIESMKKIGAVLDVSISKILQKSLQNKKMDFMLGCTAEEILSDRVVYRQGDKRYEEPANLVLMSVGRKPSVTVSGIAELGVDMENGAVCTDEHMQTSVAHVYAVGDVNGKSMLAHTAYREAAVAVNAIIGKRDRMRYHAVPRVIYTSPEAASIGETAESAATRGLPVFSVTVPMKMSGRYAAENTDGNGICTLLFHRDIRTLVGAHLIGSYVSELAAMASMMIEMEMRPKDIQEIVFPHPSVSEIFREAAYAAEEQVK